VAQNEKFEFLRAVAARERHDEREQPTGEDVHERHEHSSLWVPETRAPLLRGRAWTEGEE
jgi:hypothetical protein